jgi:hypothetical protein
MPLATAYLVTPKNLEAFLNAIKTAQAPERFTSKFLTDLDFTSSNDRLFIGLFKALGFINESGEPMQRYFDFLDQTRSGRVLAQAIREAYDDLFRVNKDAQNMDENEVKNKLKTLTRGEKSDNVLGLMAKTFVSLSQLADWDKPDATPGEASAAGLGAVAAGGPPAAKPAAGGAGAGGKPSDRYTAGGVHYNIQIHLPASRDSAVYDAIFKSLKEHLP